MYFLFIVSVSLRYIRLLTKFRKIISFGALVVAIKPKAEENFQSPGVLVCILQR